MFCVFLNDKVRKSYFERTDGGEELKCSSYVLDVCSFDIINYGAEIN